MVKALKVGAYLFLALFLFNFTYIMLREHFGLKGCVLCDEVQDVVLSKTH